eukprot:12389748-Alexandrium_andersonii.AAC.1
MLGCRFADTRVARANAQRAHAGPRRRRRMYALIPTLQRTHAHTHGLRMHIRGARAEAAGVRLRKGMRTTAHVSHLNLDGPGRMCACTI